MNFFAISAVLLTLLCLPSAAQSQWCYEGECRSDCPSTIYILHKDWAWCECPTSSECLPASLPLCNKCIISMLAWCDDPFNPYCHTYFLTGYNQFCGCEYGYAGLQSPPSFSYGKSKKSGRFSLSLRRERSG